MTWRLHWQKGAAEVLLPILREALRRVEGPLWEEILAVIVQWADQHPDQVPLLQQMIPELRL